MNWYSFLDLCEYEKIMLQAINVYCKYAPDARRKGTFPEIAFIEFRHMWE